MLDYELLNRLREERRYSYEYLAERLGYSSASGAWKVLTGSHQLRANQLNIVAEIFEVPVQSLFRNDVRFYEK